MWLGVFGRGLGLGLGLVLGSGFGVNPWVITLGQGTVERDGRTRGKCGALLPPRKPCEPPKTTDQFAKLSLLILSSLIPHHLYSTSFLLLLLHLVLELLPSLGTKFGHAARLRVGARRNGRCSH
eukprot:6073324-Prymnesium_polylepis.2